MKSIFILLLLSFYTLPILNAEQKLPLRPVNTYSIVAFDKKTGEMGVAVHSHWFSVGSVVLWGEAGTGVVATQSFAEISYGPLGLELMRSGKSAGMALKGLIAADPYEAVRQVAMLDKKGNVSVHTGKGCIREAAHVKGDGFSCQANMMGKKGVPEAMAKAFKNSKGALVDRLMAALKAAETKGGDIRGKQSAALLVVGPEYKGASYKGRLFDLRVEDHKTPLKELSRLIDISKAYLHMNRGDAFMTEKKTEKALKEYSTAMKLYPGNPELVFWPAVLLAKTGKVEESLPFFRKVFKVDRSWLDLLKRLVEVGQFPDDKALIRKIALEADRK